MEKLKIIAQLVEKLDKEGIRYCHWKSNIILSDSLRGKTDIDLLVDRKFASRFRTVLSQLSFKPAEQKDTGSFPSVEHYYALDEESGVLVHVHAYYRVITGQSLAKNYHFPIEEMLLQNTRKKDSIPVPTKSAELVIFTLRMMLKHTSIMEIILLDRYWKNVQWEITWLLEKEPIEETKDLIKIWLPKIDINLFSKCVEALKSPDSKFNRVVLGLRLRSQLRPYTRHSAIHVWLDTIYKFLIMFFRRIVKSHKGMISHGGGSIIAFVGTEATGKSTLIAEMREWLGEHYAVKKMHVGKPKSSIFTIIPNFFLPIFRLLFPNLRSTTIADQNADIEQIEQKEKPPTNFPLLFVIRSVLLAYDRWFLLMRANRQAMNGVIILCDRYPSLVIGAPDSPQLGKMLLSSNRISIRRYFARIEARLYSEIPTPDLIVYLNAPLEVVLSRNANRGKREPENYVRRRFFRSGNLEFGKAPVCKINTDQPLDKTILEVKKAIWDVL